MRHARFCLQRAFEDVLFGTKALGICALWMARPRELAACVRSAYFVKRGASEAPSSVPNDSTPPADSARAARNKNRSKDKVRRQESRFVENAFGFFKSDRL